MPPLKPVGRREFLATAGAASLALACSPRTGPERFLPALVPTPDGVAGTPLYYRTACRACPAGCGVTATSREGRVVKLEGNPEDPIGAGALCARGQAELQALYHPARFAGPMRRAGGVLAPATWTAAEAALRDALAAARARGPGRIRLVSRLEPGSAGRAQRDFLRALGGAAGPRVVLEPLDPAAVRAAAGLLLGREEVPVLDVAAARSVVAFGADLLETWGSPVEQSRQLAAGRGRTGPDRTRLTWVGPRLALTGAVADRWVRTRAGGERAVALGLLRVIAADGTGLAPEVAALRPGLAALDPGALARSAGVAWPEIEALARELLARRPSALAGPGPAAQGPEATRLAGAVLLANLALGNAGRTLHFGLGAGEDAPSRGAEVRALVEDLAAGRVDVLLLHHADLVSLLPAASGIGAALDKVRCLVTFASRPDATTGRAHLVLPDHHPLEAFGDLAPRRGVIQSLQPALVPLADSRPASDVLLAAAAALPAPAAPVPPGDLRARVAAKLAEVAGGPIGGAPHRAAQERGGSWSPAVPAAAPAVPRLLPGAAAPFLAPPSEPSGPAGSAAAVPETTPASPGAAGSALELDLVPFPTALRSGGDLPWLQERHDAMSSVAWSPWLELSPATAARLGLSTGELAVVATAGGEREVGVYVTPAIRDDAAGLPMGGPEWPALAPWAHDPAGVLVRSGARATVRAAVRADRRVGRALLPILEGSPYQHGRAVVPAVSARAPAVPPPPYPPEPEVHAPGTRRWAMVIDLDRCTGCQACEVACAAENNVPVAGPEAARDGRAMGWIRIERYLGDAPESGLDVRLLPMLCQQCGSAPCEPVCPVYATYHTAEGLNAQVYNRCVGTRYCANNCPYKARTFNWREPAFEKPLDLQLNPEVAVRSRGVMEKCTFCVQRIRAGEGQARAGGRPLLDGEIVPACAQTCPARAIVFGDAADPASRVAALAREPRGFTVLADLGTRPAVTYLAPVREQGEP